MNQWGHIGSDPAPSSWGQTHTSGQTPLHLDPAPSSWGQTQTAGLTPFGTLDFMPDGLTKMKNR